MLYLLQYMIGLAYIALGYYVYVYKKFVVPLDSMISTGLAILLACYGVFRIVRAYLKSKKSDEN